MPPSRLSGTTTIAATIAPGSIRWELPQTIAGERLRDCVTALHKRVRALDDAVAVIDADAALTEIGKRKNRALLGAAALRELDAYKPYEQAKRSVQSDVEMLERQMTDLPKAPESVAEVALAQEIRAFIKQQNSPIDFAVKNLGDRRVLSALLNAPPFLSGLSEAEHNLVLMRSRTAAHPKQTATIAELSNALGELTEAMGATRRLIGERAQVRHTADADGQYRSIHEAEPAAVLSGRAGGSVRVSAATAT